MSDEKMKVEIGTHKVTISSFGIGQTKAGKPSAWIKFSNGASINNVPNASAKGDEIFTTALVLCGFQGSDIFDLTDPNALSKTKEVEIFVKYKDDQNGQPQMQVYVNNPNRSAGLNAGDAKSLLKQHGVSIKQALKDARKELGITVDTSVQMAPESADFSADDIPF
jgi:hypothetical protein